MTDKPVIGPDDSNRTIIRPNPGRRRPHPVEVSVEMQRVEQADASTARSIAPAEGTESLSIGEDVLAAAASPLLQLLARLHNTVNPPASGDLRQWIVQQIGIFEREARDRGIAAEQLRSGHYALCAALDDVVLNTPWGSTGSWSAQPLVPTFHQDVRSGERFFDMLRQMCESPGKFLPVIKLMYLCLSLGFIGQYRHSRGGAADINRIREQTYAVICRQQKAPDSELAPHTKGIRAPHRSTRIRVPLWIAVSSGLGIAAGLFAWFTIDLNATSDSLYAHMRDAPPARMPTIARGLVVEAQPPTRSLSPSEPALLDKLRRLLQPEIDQGLVEVMGTPAQPLVRVAGRGMFTSGGATVQPGIKPLLDRIGRALKGEAGTVRVIDYTDDQSIRTMAFPSNSQLSASRAQAASAIIAAAIGDASRVSSEGRADAEPLVANTTPEGRERNRRIEIVFVRQGP